MAHKLAADGKNCASRAGALFDQTCPDEVILQLTRPLDPAERASARAKEFLAPSPRVLGNRVLTTTLKVSHRAAISLAMLILARYGLRLHNITVNDKVVIHVDDRYFPQRKENHD